MFFAKTDLVTGCFLIQKLVNDKKLVIENFEVKWRHCCNLLRNVWYNLNCCEQIVKYFYVDIQSVMHVYACLVGGTCRYDASSPHATFALLKITCSWITSRSPCAIVLPGFSCLFLIHLIVALIWKMIHQLPFYTPCMHKVYIGQKVKMISHRLLCSFWRKANIEPPKMNKHDKHFFFKILF